MKKIGCLLMILVLTVCVTACGNSNNKSYLENRSSACLQPGSFFPDGEQRYILVDESTQRLGGEDVHCYIYVDKYSYLMYEYQVRNAGTYYESTTMFQLNSDNYSPMEFDNDER